MAAGEGLTQGNLERETRRAEAGFGGNWHGRNRDFPGATGPTKHWAVHTLHGGGRAQTEHRTLPFLSGLTLRLSRLAQPIRLE